jgi:hypothetical protein
VGGDGQNLQFTSIALAPRSAWAGPFAPRVAGNYKRAGAAQGELRSHGFFYKPETDDTGMLGLPIRGSGGPGAAHLVEGSASVLFLENESLDLHALGELTAGNAIGQGDACKASCVDWYGNARPIFLRGRIFALMGYEIVEGQKAGARILERRRVSFAPVRM